MFVRENTRVLEGFDGCEAASVRLLGASIGCSWKNTIGA